LPDNDRELLERHLERVTLTPNHLELRLRQSVETAQAHDPANDSAGPPIANVTTMAVPWSSPVPAAVPRMTAASAEEEIDEPASKFLRPRTDIASFVACLSRAN
jgi:hypothetical protein